MKLTKREAGTYVTEDGRYEVSKGWTYSFCEGPHPLRDGGYCDGDAEHGSVSWGVWDVEHDDYAGSDAGDFATKREAVAYLERVLAGAETGEPIRRWSV